MALWPMAGAEVAGHARGNRIGLFLRGRLLSILFSAGEQSDNRHFGRGWHLVTIIGRLLTVELQRGKGEAGERKMESGVRPKTYA